MTSTELMVIKRYQREFNEAFNKPLVIDWGAMNGTNTKRVRLAKSNLSPKNEIVDDENSVTLEEALQICVKRHGADLSKITDRSARLHKAGYCNERLALIDFAKLVFSNSVNRIEAAKLVNRDRSVLYHYLDLGVSDNKIKMN